MFILCIILADVPDNGDCGGKLDGKNTLHFNALKNIIIFKKIYLFVTNEAG